MKKHLLWALLLMFIVIACAEKPAEKANEGFKYETEKFADLRILRFQVPGFEELDLKTKKLLYFLAQAGLAGRDMIYDQNYKHNLTIRRTLEAVVEHYQGDRQSEAFNALMVYTKRVWFSNGIHHHYGMEKFEPGFSYESFAKFVNAVPKQALPTEQGESVEQLLQRLKPVMFDKSIAAKRVNLDADADLVAHSANNYYEGVTQAEVEAFYKKFPKSDTPPSYGLNSKLVKENGKLVEKVWKVGGMYSQAIEKVVYWLAKAAEVAENEKQKKSLNLLIKYYKTGDLKVFDDYSIAWVEDTESDVDVINGFIEVYGDAMGYRGAFESVVQVKDPIASKRIEAISKRAQWFEDNSSIMEEHKKPDVKGITANVINAVSEAGDASPSTPIGINLPNANWIRANHGSKSVNLGNIVDAYSESSKSSGSLEEFAWNKEEVERAKKWGKLGGNLHTDMHEVIGHASGKINEGIGTPKETLKNYSSTLEEARADLVALYFIMDERLVKEGVLPSLEPGKAEYDGYIRNGLMQQLKRIKLGKDIQESHMRNRQLNAAWVYEKGLAEKVIEKKVRDGKTYFVINDYMKLKKLFGDLLREIQRIKSEGDFEAGKALVENYGVKVDQAIHKEVLARYEKLNIPAYSGFIQPKLTAVKKDGKIVDITIEYPDDFTTQMMFYSKNYSFLPNYN